jgi:internalin A
MTQSINQVTNITNTKPAIKPDQLAILQELSKLLDTPLKEIENIDILKCYYSSSLIPYSISLDGDVIGLSVYDKNITDLEMNLICQLEDLSHLYLNASQIQHIDSISKLSNLRHLYLSENHIQDVSSLTELKNLTDLSLNSNQIQDISPLSKLTSLSRLYLDNNKIRDISSLSELSNLGHLYIKNNNLRYLNNLHKLSQIEGCDHTNWKQKKKYFKREPLF